MMDPVDPPPIFGQQARDLLLQMLRRIPTRFPAWKPVLPVDDAALLALADDEQRDFGMALLKLAAHMGGTVAGQINRVPHKNFVAFLDFLGMDRTPPMPARAPLSFTLSEKAPADRLVPKGTQVGVAKREDVVFETDTDLLVTRARLTGAYSVDLRTDRSIDLGRLITQPGIFALEVFGQADPRAPWQANVHALYLGHDTLYTTADQAGAEIRVSLQVAAGAAPVLDCAYSTAQGWQAATAVPGAPGAGLTRILKTPGIAPMTLKGHDDQGAAISRRSCWIRAQARNVTSMQLAGHPGLATRIQNRPAPIDAGVFNSGALDLSKDFFPFGERPRFNDTFYFASRQAFGVEGAEVVLTVTLSHLPATVAPVVLSWEYWTGSVWTELGKTSEAVTAATGPFSFSDDTRSFNKDGEVKFHCPPMAPTTLLGVLGWWLRVRIVSGGYGREAGYQQGANQALLDQLHAIETDPDRYQSLLDLLTRNGLVGSFVYEAASYAPPSIQRLALAYSITSSAAAEQVLTENNFMLRDVTALPSFQPYVAWDDTRPAVYLEFDPASTLAGTPLSIHIQVVQPQFGPPDPAQVVGTAEPAAVVWWYWAGTGWQRLPAEDQTANLTRSGLLRFIVPPDAVPRFLFDRLRLWLRASLEAGGYASPPRLAAFTLNTVWASHGVSFHDHVLGASNGDPGQRFHFAKTPVLQGQVIEVREPTLPGDAERLRIEAEEGADAVRTVNDAASNVLQVWVRWHAVPSLNLSSPADRHYVVDSITGTVAFGDGTQGRIPPAGRENVVARFFRAGGGAQGLCAQHTLTELKTSLATVDRVTNHEASFGGTDPDSVDDVLSDGPRRIKSRDRAVTAEDFEWLAREAAPEVAMSRCLPLTRAATLAAAGRQGDDPGWVTVIVVPKGMQDQPVPTDQLIAAVRGYLADRSTLTLAGRIDVIGPQFAAVDVEAAIVPRRIEEGKTVEKRVFDNLRSFLHPLSGGPDGRGWEFGRPIHLSEIAAVVQGSEGVDRVRSLLLRRSGSSQVLQHLLLSSNELPASGAHRIVAAGA